ncbi:MAG: DtxR family transcriptional regulator [Candidatus Hecatellales archaeon ex4484_218]|nr:MAG: DtxR family transcriptional regulator [Candidatus Hecatellales archaeon ex4484_218]
MDKVSSTVEEYLKTILRLEEKFEIAKTSVLAEVLKVALGTVTNTVEKLEKQGLVIHEPYKGIKLTEKGRKIALEVLRRHRLSERLLTDLLGVDWSRAHEIACKLEHNLPNDILKNLEKVLGHPKTCPHGNPIPTSCGEIFEESSEPLLNLKQGDVGIIVKITEEEKEILEHLRKFKLIPGSLVKVLEKTSVDSLMKVKVEDVEAFLSFRLASIINVKKV